MMIIKIGNIFCYDMIDQNNHLLYIYIYICHIFFQSSLVEESNKEIS
jgi:hypothetical protein